MVAEANVGDDRTSQGLLAALWDDDEVVASKAEELNTAVAAYEVATRRYAAMREAVRERLGTSPYAPNVRWPMRHDPSSGFPMDRPNGQFRFVQMKIGDAIVEALQESATPLNLEQIVRTLADGGLGSRDMRSVNAALINTKGIKPLSDGMYTYEKEEEDETQRVIFPTIG